MENMPANFGCQDKVNPLSLMYTSQRLKKYI